MDAMLRLKSTFGVVALLVFLLTTNVEAKCKRRDRKGVNIGTELPEYFEPSDAAWDPDDKLLYIVSDEGSLASIDADGKVVNLWRVEKDIDLEGLAFVPGRDDYAYLGVEAPGTIQEFRLSDSTLTRAWDLFEYGARESSLLRGPSAAGQNKEDGLESLLFVPSSHSRYGGFFYAGWQRSALIQVFELDLEDPKSQEPIYRGYIEPPGPGEDLAAMSEYQGKLYLFFDKPMTMVAVSLDDPAFIPNPGVQLKTKAASAPHDTWLLERRGIEGIAFGTVGGKTYLFACEDPPKGGKEKTVRRYDADRLDACFRCTDNSCSNREPDFLDET